MTPVGPPPRRLPDGSIYAPIRAEGPDGLIGDGAVILRRGDPLYDEWDRWLKDGNA
jgi:hypothetical protein